jgi:hypothetical protein
LKFGIGDRGSSACCPQRSRLKTAGLLLLKPLVT